MKVRSFINRKLDEARAEDEAAGFDIRQHRTLVADAIAVGLTRFGPTRVDRQKAGVVGPLGGESDRIDFTVDTPAGPKSYYLCLYAKGVYAMSREVPG